MRICICATQVPFEHGGAEDLVESLHHELRERGFESTIVRVPFSSSPRIEIHKSALAWRLIGLGGPADAQFERRLCTALARPHAASAVRYFR